MWVDHMKIRKNSGIENSHIFNLEGTADKILDFFLRRKRVLAKYTKEEKQKAIAIFPDINQQAEQMFHRLIEEMV